MPDGFKARLDRPRTFRVQTESHLDLCVQNKRPDLPVHYQGTERRRGLYLELQSPFFGMRNRRVLQ